MSDTHQTTAAPAQSSPTISAPATSSQANNGAAAPAAAPAAPFWEGFTDKGLAADKSIVRYQTPEELARGYVNLEKRFGVPAERRIDLPEDMTAPDALRPVFAKLGLPEKADGYGFKLPDGASEADQAMLGKYTEAAHKAGVPTPQARQMLDWWVQMNAESQAAQAQALTQRKSDGEAALKTAFGNAYDDRMREAGNLLARYDPKKETGLTAENLTTFPAWTQMMMRMADRMAEPETGAIPGGQTEQPDRPLTPAQANAKLSEFNLDQAKQTALFDEKNPAHKAVVAERNKLLEAANPRPGAAR
jgi:hypothetical protein